jgi:hypothetical protein
MASEHNTNVRLVSLLPSKGYRGSRQSFPGMFSPWIVAICRKYISSKMESSFAQKFKQYSCVSSYTITKHFKLFSGATFNATSVLSN